MAISLNIEPFDSISDAIDALEVAFRNSSLKFKCENFSSYERNKLVYLLTACKAMLTIENRFYEFKKYYHIECKIKLLWDNTTWKAEVKDFRNKIVLTSGSYLCGYNNAINRKDENPYCAQTMISQLRSVLIDAQSKWGTSNFEWMYNREVKLISKINRFNKYSPCDDYYGIYSGNN